MANTQESGGKASQWGEDASAPERVKELPMWAQSLILRLRGMGPGAELELSRHKTVRAAGVRVAQMRRTKRWGELPIYLRAGEAAYVDGDDREGAVFVQLASKPFSETARRRMQVDWSAGTPAQRTKLFMDLFDGYENGTCVTLPDGLLRVTLPGPTPEEQEAVAETMDLDMKVEEQ